MTSNEFVLWLKGFTEGVHEFNITPKQWDLLKEKLAEVKDDVSLSPFPFGTPNITPISPLPHYPNPFDKPFIDPYNPYRVTCSSGSFGTITTPGTTGFITTYNPSSVTYSTGSAWSYTTSNEKIF
jgi:hypothetical protein